MPIPHTSVSAMRDTFGHILLEMSKQDATRYVQGAPHGFVVVRHLHDEATMRLRSKLPSPAGAPAAPALAAAPTAAPAPLAAPAALAQCPGPRSTHLCLYVSETNTAQPPGKVHLMLSQAPSAASPEIPGHLPCVPRSTCISDHHRDGWTMSRLGVVLPASQTGHRGPPISFTGMSKSGNSKDILGDAFPRLLIPMLRFTLWPGLISLRRPLL